jgi:hypothetical protein
VRFSDGVGELADAVERLAISLYRVRGVLEFPRVDELGELRRRDLVRTERTELDRDEPDEYPLGVSNTAVFPSFAELAERPEARAFFDAATRAWLRWYLRAPDCDGNALRWRTPFSSRQSANHLPDFIFISISFR